MNLLNTIINWANQRNIDCIECNHPSYDCSGSCQDCLYEIHYWHRNPKLDRRKRYNCRALAYEYVISFTERYCENILFACEDIDLSCYDDISILSLGCGISPDLMAFEKILNGDYFFYRGVDDNRYWNEFHDIIYEYSSNHFFDVDYLTQSAFVSSNAYNEIYNVIVMQFFISSVLSEGGSYNDFQDLFDELIDSILLRWYNSKLKSPFLFILNDTDSVFTGRKQFFQLLEALSNNGHKGNAFARSAHISDDMADRNNMDFRGFNLKAMTDICNNSASLVIEVEK